MFFENESECRNKVFWRIRLRQPVWSYTPITIIHWISWAGLSVHKVYFYYHIFVRTFFSSIIDALIKNLKKTLKLGIDLENLKVLFLTNSRELPFLWECIIGVCSLNVLKNMFVMLLPSTHSIDCNYDATEINVMEICVAKSLFQICRWKPIQS